VVAPATVAAEYIFTELGQTPDAPEIEAGEERTEDIPMDKVRMGLIPHALTARTEIFPPEELATVFILVDVDEPVQPDGVVQEYDNAPGTVAILYVFEEDGQMVVFPIIAAGVEGTVFTVTVLPST